MNASQTLQKMLVDWIKGITTTPPAGLMLALSSTPIAMNGTGITEPSAGFGYARRPITFGAEAFVNGTGTTLKNDTPIVFGPAAGGDWPVVNYGAIFTTAGVLVAAGQLGAPRLVQDGDSYSLSMDAIQFLSR